MNNSTLWASWMIRGPQHALYYSGDTGYAEHFKTIRAWVRNLSGERHLQTSLGSSRRYGQNRRGNPFAV